MQCVCAIIKTKVEKMLDSKGFDLWSNNYDKVVSVSDEDNAYPFAGYKSVLGEIYKIIRNRDVCDILDIGFGTGILTKKLYDDGYKIFGIDFSKEMIKIASEKMPNANLIEFDFSKGFPKKVNNKNFDIIISSYAIHHISDEQKKDYILELTKHLNENGLIIFGDVIFETKKDMEECKTQAGDYWDDEEYYIIVEEIKKQLPSLKIDFIKKSYCSGVLVITSFSKTV